MSPNARPDRETLLLWISAFFDGELPEADEARLFEAMAVDPALEADFETACRFREESHRLLMERTLGATAELAGLADAVMAQVAPEATDAAGAAALLSAYVDDEADDAQRARFSQLIGESQRTAREALSFLHAAEAIERSLAALPESAAVQAAVAALPAAVSARVADEERAAELLSAFVDDAVNDAEQEELQDLLTGGATPELSFLHAAEAVAHVVRAAVEHPAAARAGAAALQNIEAEAQQARAATTTSRAAAKEPSWLERVRAGFSTLVTPLAAAACAAAVFVALQGGPGTSALGSDAPPEDWARAFLPALDDELLAAATPEAIEVLGDNSDTEVQAIDSGSQMAAVFSTEASAITVIWVPEPLPDALGADVLHEDGTESGT